ncbi:hypothetical protein N2152v2_010611 [Parachlorella kessleri]
MASPPAKRVKTKCSPLKPLNVCTSGDVRESKVVQKAAGPSYGSGDATQQADGQPWSVRAFFLPAQQKQQQPSAIDFDDCSGCELGPLTQMAAAGAEPLSHAFCPHCGCFLSDVGDTEAQRQKHVASCQSNEAAAVVAGGEAEAGAAGQADNDGHSEAEEEAEGQHQLGGEEEEGVDNEAIFILDDDAEEDSCPGQSSPEAEPSIEQWLAQRGLQKYADCFARAGAGLSLLAFLDHEDLRQMGVVTLGARKKILMGAAELASGAAPAAAVLGGVHQDVTPVQPWDGGSNELAPDDEPHHHSSEKAAHAGGQAASSWTAMQQPNAVAAGITEGAQPRSAGQSSEAGAVGDIQALSGMSGATLFCGNIRRYFQPDPSKPPQQQQQQQPAQGILQYFQPAGVGPAAKPWKPAAAPAAAPGATRRSATVPAAAGRGRAKQAQWAHKVAEGDGSGAGAGRRFGGGRGATTQAVPLKPWHLVPGTSFVVDRFDKLPPGLPNKHWFLTHFHADHYKGLSSRFDRGMLHCSPPTARLVQQQLRVPQQRIKAHPLNTPFDVEGVRVTFLDANHCPGAVMVLFELPGGGRPVLHTGDCRLVPAMQQEPALQVLQFSIDAVKAEAFNPKTLFLFGSYTIGKERLFLEAARVLQRKVYVSATKRKVLDCLDLPQEYSSLLTTNDVETNLHAVPLWMVTDKHMTKILKHYRGRFTNVVGFQPTGWTHQRDVNKTRARGRRRQKGTIITYQVPYSEHSSFTELREFVGWLKPVRILPHVNTDDGGPKANRMGRGISNAAFTAASGKEIVVGGDKGWGLGVDYSAGIQATEGDVLVFNFRSGTHDVWEVPGDSCDFTANGAKALTDGSKPPPPIKQTLAAPGTYFFACSFDGHCQGGMLVKVTVTGAVAASTSPSPSGPPEESSQCPMEVEDLIQTAEPDFDGEAQVVWADTINYANGTVRTYMTFFNNDSACSAPKGVGIEISHSALANLPAANEVERQPPPFCSTNATAPGCFPPGDTLFLPFFADEVGSFNPFQVAEFDWNPEGHTPAGTYDVPHIDFHFYLTNQSAIMDITPGPCAELSPAAFLSAMQPVPQKCFPEGNANFAATAPLAAKRVVSQPTQPLLEGFSRHLGQLCSPPKWMGNHLLNLGSPEIAALLEGEPGAPFWNSTYIWGVYNGEVTFFEVMAKRDYLEEEPNFCAPIPGVPQEFAISGYKPHTYCILTTPTALRVELRDFSW